MKLPGTPPTLGQYLTDVNALIANPKTRLYIDSSFLVWALKLGQTSIGEFVGFLESVFPDRIHVPLWTAHEFQHHLVKSTATDQARKAIDDMEGAGRRLYPELAPLLSEASDPPNRDQSQLRLAARDAFIELSSIAKILQAWMKENSEASRSALITFINAHCLKSALVFDYLQSLDELAIRDTSVAKRRTCPISQPFSKTKFLVLLAKKYEQRRRASRSSQLNTVVRSPH